MLTVDQQREIVEKFSRKVHEYKCPICGSPDFKFMNGFVVMPLQSSTESFQSSSRNGLPCIAINCEHCGHLSFFNTITLGIEENEKK